MNKKRTLRDGIAYVRAHSVAAIMATPDAFMPLFVKRMLCIYIQEIASDAEILKWRNAENGEVMRNDMMAHYEAIYAIYVTRFGEEANHE